MNKSTNILTLMGILLLGACATTEQTPTADVNSKEKNSTAKATSTSTSTSTSVDAELINTWNRTDLHVPFNEWPGKMEIKGNWGAVKELRRVLKLNNADIPEPYASLYAKDEYQTKAFRQTRSILGSYTKNPTDEMIGQFMSSPWAKRYMRYDYVKKLSKNCNVQLTDAEVSAYKAYKTLEGPSPQAYVCSGNPNLKELPLP